MKKQPEQKTIDSYIGSQLPEVQPHLQKIRQLIKSAAPNTQEIISYNMPAFKATGVLVYFAACKNHLGFYPAGSVTTLFRKELMAFKCTKGAIQFPYDSQLPATLIKRIVKFRMNEDKESALQKQVKKSGSK